MAVQPFLIQRQPKEREEPKKTPLDYLLIGLDVANKGFGIAANYQTIENAKANRATSEQEQELNKIKLLDAKREANVKASGYKAPDKNELVPATAETPNAMPVRELGGFEGENPKFNESYYVKKPKADYTTKELDNLVGGGGFRIGKEGEKGESRSVLLPSGETKSVLLVNTAPEKASATKAEKEAERQKDLQIAKLNSDSKALTNELKNASKDMAYEGLPKESKIQIDKIAGSMGDVTAVRNSLKADLEQYKNAKTEAEKITIGESMIKTLNSKMGKDAVGTEEAQRLAPYLTYQKGNAFGAGAFIGRDLPAFEKQVEASLAGLDRSISLGSEKIAELKGIPTQQNASQSKAPITSEDQKAFEWASKNIMSPDAKTAQQARAILSNTPAAQLAKKQNSNQPPSFGGSVPMTGFRGR